MSYYDQGVGTTREWSLRINCDKAGCDPRHGDHGKKLPIDEETVARGEYVVNGHPCDLLSRVVTREPWEVCE